MLSWLQTAEGLLHGNLYKNQFLCLGSFCISIWKGEYQPTVLHKLTLIIMKTHRYLAAALSWIICQVMHIHDVIWPQHNPKGRDGYSGTKDKDAEGAGHVKDRAGTGSSAWPPSPCIYLYGTLQVVWHQYHWGAFKNRFLGLTPAL